MKNNLITASALENIYYYRVGERSSLPLVLIHGYGASGAIWQPIVPYLVQHYQVFVVDLPGYGRSKLTGEWRIREMGPLLAAWLRNMHLPSAAIVGHSMGGAIAAHLTAVAPELIDRLVLISAAGIPIHASLPALVLRSIQSLLQSGITRYPPASLRDVRRLRRKVLWQTLHDMISSDFRVELTSISIPTLVIWGERDVLLPITVGHTLSETLPQATFVTLPGGHQPVLKFPAELSRLILQFLE